MIHPHLCRVALRPRGPLEILDLTVRLARERWRTLGLAALGILLPLWLAVLPLCWFAEGHWALLGIPLVLAPVLRAPFTQLGGRLLFADTVSLSTVATELVGRLPWLLAAWGLLAAAWLVGIGTFGAALIPAQAVTHYLPEAALLERVEVGRGVRRSIRLAGGHLGSTLAGTVVQWALVAWAALVAEASGQAIVRVVLQLGEPFGSLANGAITPWLLGGMIAVQPLIALYRLLLYVDVRTRVEGWDLQVDLRAAGLAR